MLINCPECSLQISDKAVFCPHCGIPLKSNSISRISTRRKRLPNGFGSITFIKKANLRKPYRASFTSGFDHEGRPIVEILKPVGYFTSYNDAYEALIEHQKNPYDVSKDVTFKELYDEWITMKAKTEAQGNINHYKMGYNNCKQLYNMKIRDIKPKVIRMVIENEDNPSSAPKRIKVLLNLLLDYAVENEIVDRNYARSMKISTDVKDSEVNHHISFTDEEILTLWQHTDNGTVKEILIQCYSGFRPGELTSLKPENIFLKENYMIGGNKTEAGRNRKVPIHPAIKPFVEYFYENSTRRNWPFVFQNSNSYKSRTETYRYAFRDVVMMYKLNPAHRTHDPRKFFVTQAKRSNLDEYAIKLIIGHAIRDITEKIYTERSFEWLYSEMLKIKPFGKSLV